jgi:hypothetical protein
MKNEPVGGTRIGPIGTPRTWWRNKQAPNCRDNRPRLAVIGRRELVADSFNETDWHSVCYLQKYFNS